MAFISDGSSNFNTANLSAISPKTFSIAEPAGLIGTDYVIITFEYAYTGSGPSITDDSGLFTTLGSSAGSIGLAYYWALRSVVGAGPYSFTATGASTAAFRQHEIHSGYNGLTGNAELMTLTAGDTTPGGTSSYPASLHIVTGRGNNPMTQDAALTTRESTVDGDGVTLIQGDETLSTTTVPTRTGTSDNAVAEIVFEQPVPAAAFDAWAWF